MPVGITAYTATLSPGFMPVNLDCPMDGRENMFVYGSGSGVPYPSLWGCPERCAGWINSCHHLCRHCDTPRRLRRQCRSFRHPGQKALATTAAAVPEGHALYTGVVQPRGEGRPAAEVFRL